MDTLTISYQEIDCQIKIKKKGQIRSAGFIPLDWYMMYKSHEFEPVDVFFSIADSKGQNACGLCLISFSYQLPSRTHHT